MNLDVLPRPATDDLTQTVGTLDGVWKESLRILDAIRTGRAPASPIDVALRSDTICMLDDIAIRLGRTLRWDPAKEEVIDDAQAARLLTRPMRGPWHV